jgi:hypothetical protein
MKNNRSLNKLVSTIFDRPQNRLLGAMECSSRFCTRYRILHILVSDSHTWGKNPE